MELQLMEGVFHRADLIDLVGRMVDVKIRYHERKIETSSGEDDIKMREKKIKQLQEEWHRCRQSLNSEGDVQVSARIIFES